MEKLFTEFRVGIGKKSYGECGRTFPPTNQPHKIMTKLNVYSFADYATVRFLAHSMKNGDRESIFRAATYMAHLVMCLADNRSVIVPMPGRTGVAVYTRRLAEHISDMTGVRCLDCLTCKPHMTQYLRKMCYGIRSVRPMTFNLSQSIPADVTPILIDNVLDTGTTAFSAMQVFGRTLDMVVLGSTNHFRLFDYPINLYEQSLALQ